MGFQGYSVNYCESGHDFIDKTQFDTENGMCWCGKPSFVYDTVDLTNGCSCESEEGEPDCPAHRKTISILKYTPRKCTSCEGKGRSLRAISRYKKVKCDCKGKDKACEDCYGTGIKRVPKFSYYDCPVCQGTGIDHAAVFDIRSLLIQRIKTYTEMNNFYKGQLKEVHTINTVSKGRKSPETALREKLEENDTFILHMQNVLKSFNDEFPN